MPTSPNILPPDLVTEVRKAVTHYVTERPPSKLDRFLKLVPIISVLLVVVGIPLSFKAFQAPIENAINGYVTNTEDRPLEATRFSAPVASSYRQDTNHTSVHRPLNLLDGDARTAWAECRGGQSIHPNTTRSSGKHCRAAEKAELEGAGEWVEIPVTKAVDVRALKIRNGFQKSQETFFRNPRVRDLKIQMLDMGGVLVEEKRVTLLDEPGYQAVSLRDDGTPVNLAKVRLLIVSSYPGETFLKKPPYDDTSVSDVQLIPQRLRN